MATRDEMRRMGRELGLTLEEVEAFADRLTTDPAFVAKTKKQLLKGTLGVFEPLLWYFAYGMPEDNVEVTWVGATASERQGAHTESGARQKRRTRLHG